MVASSSVLRTSAPGINEQPFNVNILLTSISVSPKTCTWKIQMQTTLRKGEEPDRSVPLSLPICYQEVRIEWRTTSNYSLLIKCTPDLVSNLNHWIFFSLWKRTPPSGTLNVEWQHAHRGNLAPFPLWLMCNDMFVIYINLMVTTKYKIDTRHIHVHPRQ